MTCWVVREKWDEIVQAGLRCNLFRDSEGVLIWIRSSVVDMCETCFKWLLAKGRIHGIAVPASTVKWIVAMIYILIFY